MFSNFQKPVRKWIVLAVLLLLAVGSIYTLATMGQGIPGDPALFPDLYTIEVRDLEICDGTALHTYDQDAIPQAVFRENKAFICGHVKNLFPAQPARPSFVIIPVAGPPAIFNTHSKITIAEGEFFIPITNTVPRTDDYTIHMNRGRTPMFTASFTVQ